MVQVAARLWLQRAKHTRPPAGNLLSDSRWRAHVIHTKLNYIS